MPKPFVVIGRYKPKRWRGSIIGPALLERTRALGLKPLQDDKIQRNKRPIWEDYDSHAEVRRTAVPGSEGTQWHKDGDTSTNNMDFALVLWSNRDSTEFRTSDGEIHQARPFDIVIVRNLGASHRRPPGVVGKRWSFRQRVELPTNMQLP